MGAEMSSDSFTTNFLNRRSLLVAAFALTACESDPTPIVEDAPYPDAILQMWRCLAGRMDKH